MSAGLRVLPLGIGDAFSARYYSSCIALEADGEWLLIDCPHPIRKMMREASEASGLSLDIPQVRAIALTHLHADHCSGLEGYAYFSFFALGRKARLITHPQVRKRLWEGSLAAGMERLILEGEGRRLGFEEYFAYQPITAEAPVVEGPFEIACRKTIHHIPTTAFRIRAGGRTLGYSADTAFDEGLIAWLSEADLVIHETNLGAHTPYERLAALPAELRAKMRLIHATDDFDREASVIGCLEQGVVVEV